MSINLYISINSLELMTKSEYFKWMQIKGEVMVIRIFQFLRNKKIEVSLPIYQSHILDWKTINFLNRINFKSVNV